MVPNIFRNHGYHAARTEQDLSHGSPGGNRERRRRSGCPLSWDHNCKGPEWRAPGGWIRTCKRPVVLEIICCR